MERMISYAYCSVPGLVRKNNEDNYLAGGENLKRINNGTKEVRYGCAYPGAGMFPVFAVFDGMGGEAAGETAAFLASEEMKALCSGPGGADKAGSMPAEELHRELCSRMNRRVLTYARKKRIRTMGTTVAYMMPAGDVLHLVNVGDSRIYLIRNGRIEQVSKDHVVQNYIFRKAPLTQFIGLPEEEYLLCPAVRVLPCEAGSRYLLCTDGVTDMLSDDEILSISEESSSLREAAGRMLAGVYENGARDNATFIMCDVGETGGI